MKQGRFRKSLLFCLIMMLCGCARGDATLPAKKEEMSVIMVQESVSKSEDATKEAFLQEEKGMVEQNTALPEQILPVPGVVSIENLLLTAIRPIGNTMYVWGGGWNEEDTGAGIPALSFGVSAAWKEFAAKQDATYDYKDTEYQINDGLDCSGYIGWLIYNVFETEESTLSTDGYVFPSTQMAEKFATMGWGECLPADAGSWKPGDICSMPGHVWMSLGMCEDGSVVVLHASPPGVRLSGTRLSIGEKSQAILLAEEYMAENYPEWYAKFPACDVSYSYLTKSQVFRWSGKTMSDAVIWQEMTAEEVLKTLFSK